MRKILFLIITVLTISNISCNNNADKLFKIGCYEENGGHIYYNFGSENTEKQNIELQNANPKQFRILNRNNQSEICTNSDVWAKDSVNVYYKQYQLLGADAKSFKILSNGYSCDNDKVYFKNIILKNADARTFKVLTNFYAKDKNKLWFCEKEVSGITDIINFEVIDGYFSKNKTSVFLNKDTVLQKLEKLDAATFTEFEDTLKKEINLKFYKDKDFIITINTEKNTGDTDYININASEF